MLFAAVILGLFMQTPGAGQHPFDVKELAAYRLTDPVFQQFEEASRLIADATRNDLAFVKSPLFTRENSLSGDAPKVAAELEARLQSHPALAHALTIAKITPREYTTFALALLGARLAHGFIDAGLLRNVPPGVAADNVQFVAEHHVEIAAVLKKLGIES